MEVEGWSKFRRVMVSGLLCIVVALLMVAPNAVAQTALDDHTVSGIVINATAENAAAARGAAMKSGQKEAFSRIYRKLNSSAKKTPDISAEAISELVGGVEIKDEKISSNSYSAVASFHFSKTEFSKFLASQNPADGESVIKIYVNAETAAELSRIERKMNSVHLISKLEPVEINGRQTAYRVYFRGGVSGLSSALTAKGLVLSLDEAVDGQIPTAYLYTGKPRV